MTRVEETVQIEVASFLDCLGLPWCHVPNERHCSPALGLRLKRQGVKAGIPDCLIFRAHVIVTPGGPDKPASNLIRHGLAIELKAPGNYPTPEQRAWLRTFADEGWTARVCKSVPEVVAVLDDAGLLVHPRTGKPLDPAYAAMGLLREAR